MHLTSCQGQKSQTLEKFYSEVSQQDSVVCREGGKAMLDIIARLRALPDEHRVYGLTSHHQLCLLAEDTRRGSSSFPPWTGGITTLSI